MDNNCGTDIVQVCRTCMKEIIDTAFFYLDLIPAAQTQLTIRQMLYSCMPELDLSIVPNSVMCSKCVDNLLSVFKFKKNCLESEIQINEYIQQVEPTGDLNLVNVVRFYQPGIKNLDAEVKIEDLEITQNFKNEDLVCETSAFNEAGECTESTEPKYLLKLQKVETQDVLFNTFDDYNINYNLSAAEENSNTHNRYIAKNCLREVIEHKDHNYSKNLNNEKIISRALSKYHKNLICCYRCSLCNYLTKYKCLFDFHIRIHLIKKNYKHIFKFTNVHTKVFRTTIKVNKTNIKGNKRKRVKNCNNYYKHSFKNQSKSKISKQHLSPHNSLKPNMRAHIVEKLYKCSICEYYCNFKVSLNEHMQIHTGEKSFSCSVCKYQSKQKSYLKQHMQIHMPERPFSCSVCEYQCSRKSILKTHILIHTGEKSFSCSVCKYQSKQKSYLKQHMQIHMPERPFSCSVCGYQCSRKSILKTHILIHTGEKPFSCSVCKYQCSQKSSLKRHILIHTGEKPFSCSVCEYQFNQKSDLKKHILIHTGEKPFSCSVCKYQCNQKSNLKRHMKIHTGKKPFSCSVCEYQCNNKSNLKRHMQIHT